MADPALAWLAEHHPGEVADFPTEHTGRSHRELHLSEDGLGQVMYGNRNPLRGNRPGDDTPAGRPHQQRLSVHLAVLNEQADVLRQQAQAEDRAIEDHPCSQCGTEVSTRARVIRRGRVYRDVGERCFNRLDRAGPLAA